MFLLGADGRVRRTRISSSHNNCAGGRLGGAHWRQLTGEGEGDDEVIKVDLANVPANVEKIVVAVTIHDADSRGQNFGMVSSASVRIVNQDGGAEIARYDLSEDSSTETAMIFGELYRNETEWKFRAVGQGFAGALAPWRRLWHQRRLRPAAGPIRRRRGGR